jgi:hypothetical protein
MFARAGTADGLSVCPTPCRERKATRVPDGSEAIVIGEEGYPHGCERQSVNREIAMHRIIAPHRLWVYVFSELAVSVIW